VSKKREQCINFEESIKSQTWDLGWKRLKENLITAVKTEFQRKYKTCSKKDRIFAIKTLFYNILSTAPFKAVPSTGDIPLPTFLPLLECFLARNFCDGAQFSYSIFLDLRVFKKRPNFLNSSPTSIEGVLRLLSAPSGRF
jgi:hypothetical protein